MQAHDEGDRRIALEMGSNVEVKEGGGAAERAGGEHGGKVIQCQVSRVKCPRQE